MAGWGGLWNRRTIPQGAIWADITALPTPVPYKCLGFRQGGEDLSVDEFMPQLAVEGLTQSVGGEGMMEHLFLRLTGQVRDLTCTGT
jgi:hypothetical protein